MVNESKKFNLLDEILDWIESFAFASFMVLLIFIFVFRTVVVDGGSMNPTLYNSQRLILTHFNYTPERGDIIVANSRGLNKTIIKRCIGVAGDEVVVDYDTHSVTVNGEVIDEPYLDPASPMMNKEYFDYTYQISENTYKYTVPEGTVFAMGDNRNGSNDSRSRDVGFIPTEDILGHALFRFYLGKDDDGNKLPGKIGKI
ncbi:MAG: signal peptidase I [Ruminococcus sp.]|nr:signal peptidase I [Ruminococcus sp.]